GGPAGDPVRSCRLLSGNLAGRFGALRDGALFRPSLSGPCLGEAPRQRRPAGEERSLVEEARPVGAACGPLHSGPAASHIFDSWYFGGSVPVLRGRDRLD